MANVIYLGKCNSFQAIQKANINKAVILFNGGRNREPEELLEARLLTDVWRRERNRYPAWGNPLVAFIQSGEKFGEFVRYKNPQTGAEGRLLVPKDFQEAKKRLLAVPQGFDEKGNPIIEVEEKGGIFTCVISDPNYVSLIRGFPYYGVSTDCDPYHLEGKFGIPAGEPERDTSRKDLAYVRYLSNKLYHSDGYVGLVGRTHPGHNSWDWRVISLDSPFCLLGVLALKTGTEKKVA